MRSNSLPPAGATPAVAPAPGGLAVVVTTFEQPARLAAVLEGYLAQRDRDFELLVADDGSGDETAAVVARAAARAAFPIRHVWQEDLGFRAAAVRNRAVAATDAPYVIFTDGDCIPAADFVAAHRRLARPGRFVAGNRVLLGPTLTERVLERELPLHGWSAGQWLAAWRRGEVNRALPALRLPVGPFRTVGADRWKGAKSCNLGLHRADFERVDGFDEYYQGWGMEDSDLVIRLLRSGVRRLSGRFAVPLFHLWHRENDRAALPENQRQLRELLAGGRTRARRGLSHHHALDLQPTPVLR